MRPDMLEPAGGLSASVVAYALALADVTVPEAAAERWTRFEQLTAYDWAMRVHLHASDNLIRVRPRPSFIDDAARLARLRDLHRPYRIYETCGHDVDGDDGQAGHFTVDTGDFITCEDGYLYSICTECCCDSGGQSETCITDHDHGRDKPICLTAAILDGDGDGDAS